MTVVQNEVVSYYSANFSETETAWSSGSVYNYGAEARDGHYIYAYAGVSGTNTTLSPANDTTWVEMRPTNYFAMLDGKTGTQTLNLNNIDIQVADSSYDVFSILNITGRSLYLKLTELTGSTVVYEETINLQDETGVVDFFSYCFSDFIFTNDVFRTLPIYGNSRLQVKLTAETGTNAAIGRLVLGRSLYVGETGMGASLGIESYSTKDTNIFGETTLIHRGAVNLESYEVLVPTEKIPMLKRKAIELDAVPILFIMDESSDSNLENLQTFGYWQSFSILVKGRNKSAISLTVKGIL